jgi:hypothetical protein
MGQGQNQALPEVRLAVNTNAGSHPETHFASVTMDSLTCANMHSSSPFLAMTASLTALVEVLESFGNNSLWENMTLDGNGAWISNRIAAGILVIAHDGSYMSSELSSLCSAGVIMYCKATRQWLNASVVERSDATSNYCGKLLGAAVALLILRAASVSLGTPLPTTVLHCDNRGVISHSKSPLTALPKKQKQADLIRLIKYLGGLKRCRTSWEWVEGHAVERKGRRHSLLPERLNDQADELAKRALVHAIAGRHVMTGDFPFEVVKFKLSGQQVCGSPWQALEADWGCRAAQELFYEKDIIRREDFHLVWWEGLGAAMAWYPKMYRVWLTKHVSVFYGNNVQQYYWSKGTLSPKCQFCGIEDEYSTHICQCEDPCRDSVIRVSVSKVHTWLVATLGENKLPLWWKNICLDGGRSQWRAVSTGLMRICQWSVR